MSTPVMVFILTIQGFVVYDQGDVVKDHINMAGLSSKGDTWELTYQEIAGSNGRISLHEDRWLMYFLHWRPITKTNEDLTPEYMSRHMLNFWGEAMNFELAGVDGETVVNGHRALSIEGALSKGAVKTRFIVWNCPETGRQFTADCNINVRRGTPEGMLDLQQQITETIICHPDSKQAPSGELSKKYQSLRWNLSFYLPENWRTSDFLYEEWFPDGMTCENGSLWSLLTDSERFLELFWKESKEEISPDLFRQFLKEVSADSAHPKEQPRIFDIRLNSLEKRGDQYIGTGTYRRLQYRKGKYQTVDCRFKGLLWRRGKGAYLAIAGLVQLKEFWGMKVDLTPSDDTLERFFREEIVPNLKDLN